MSLCRCLHWGSAFHNAPDAAALIIARRQPQRLLKRDAVALLLLVTVPRSMVAGEAWLHLAPLMTCPFHRALIAVNPDDD